MGNEKRNETKRNETVKGGRIAGARACDRAAYFLDDQFHVYTAHAQFPSRHASIMSLSKLSRLLGSSSDDSDLELLLSQVKTKRARRRLFRGTSLIKNEDVSLPSEITKVSRWLCIKQNTGRDLL